MSFGISNLNDLNPKNKPILRAEKKAIDCVVFGESKPSEKLTKFEKVSLSLLSGMVSNSANRRSYSEKVANANILAEKLIESWNEIDTNESNEGEL